MLRIKLSTFRRRIKNFVNVKSTTRQIIRKFTKGNSDVNNQDTTTRLDSPLEWIDKFFVDKLKKELVLPIDDMKLDRGKSCIINDPEESMRSKYLGNHLDKCILSLQDVLAKAPSTRWKPIVNSSRYWRRQDKTL